MPFLDIVEHEVDVDEVGLQTQSAHKHECLVYPFRSAAEDAVEQQNAGYCKRDIEHSFQEERELTMFHLLQENAGEKRHQKHDPDHPDACSVERILAANHLAHVDSDEEYRYTAPENLQMTNCLMDRSNVLHQDAPHHHDHGQPTVDRMAPDEFHIAWSKEIEHHRGRNVPEVQLIVQPETPVDGNLSEEINPVPRTSAMKTGNVEEAGDDEPGRINAEITADEETLNVRILDP